MRVALFVGLILVAEVAGLRLASGQSHEMYKTENRFDKVVARERNLPSNDTESRLMNDIACTCGTCELEPISDCKCEFAAKMRGDIKERVRTFDLSTPEARQSAYDAVRAAIGVAYGPKALTPRKALKAEDKLSWLPGTIFLAGLGWLAFAAARSIRRGRRRKRGGPEESSAP